MNNTDKPKNRREDNAYRMDNNIKSFKVRVVVENANGSETKIMSRDEAIELAHSQNKNLVEVSFNKNLFPGSICKIMDYAKFKYDQKKMQKERAKKARASKQELKEISFSIRIDENDKNIKLKHIREFIDEGCKVKMTIRMSKREMQHKNLAYDLIKELIESTKDVSVIDGSIKSEGRDVGCVITPLKK